MAKLLFDNRITEKFLTCDELADILNVSVHTIRKWKSQGIIPYFKLGRTVRFKASEVLARIHKERSK